MRMFILLFVFINITSEAKILKSMENLEMFRCYYMHSNVYSCENTSIRSETPELEFKTILMELFSMCI